MVILAQPNTDFEASIKTWFKQSNGICIESVVFQCDWFHDDPVLCQLVWRKVYINCPGPYLYQKVSRPSIESKMAGRFFGVSLQIYFYCQRSVWDDYLNSSMKLGISSVNPDFSRGPLRRIYQSTQAIHLIHIRQQKDGTSMAGLSAEFLISVARLS